MRVEDKLSLAYEKLGQMQKRNPEDTTSQGNNNVSYEQDKVVLSSAAKDASVLSQAVKQSPDVRQDRVQHIKNQLNSGTYDVSGRQVAEKVVQTAIDDLF